MLRAFWLTDTQHIPTLCVEPAAKLLTLKPKGNIWEAHCLGKVTVIEATKLSEAKVLASRWLRRLLIELGTALTESEDTNATKS